MVNSDLVAPSTEHELLMGDEITEWGVVEEELGCRRQMVVSWPVTWPWHTRQQYTHSSPQHLPSTTHT